MKPFVLALLACASACASPSNGTRAFMDPINDTCPRSGKPVAADSLTTYRGHVVGFCNTHCRDDFASDPAASPTDRAFFDAILEQRGKATPTEPGASGESPGL